MRTKTPEERLREERAMRRAVAAYTGPIKQCPPGKARGKALRPCVVSDDAAQWLVKHRMNSATPIAEQKAECRNTQMQQQQQRKQRDDRHDAPEIRCINRQQRIVELKRKQMASQHRDHQSG